MIFCFPNRSRRRLAEGCGDSEGERAGKDRTRPFGAALPAARIFWLFTIIALAGVRVSAADGQETLVAGWLERVILSPQKLVFTAKLDTGAKHTSLNASDIEVFDHDGGRWVRFSVTDRKGRSALFERPLVRMAQVKLRDEGLQSRPVVYMEICLGRFRRTAEVNLVDRSYFNYQMLIGRSFLKTGVAVDASRTFVTRPHCQEEKEP